jgi:hypothetical protein
MDTKEELLLFNATLEKNQQDERFAPLMSLVKKDEDLKQVIHDLTLFEVITLQISNIFAETLYRNTATALREANDEGVDLLIENFYNKYVEECTSNKKIEDIPDLVQIITWLEDIHFGISAQIWEESFLNSVIKPAIESISEAILETAAEEDVELDETDKEIELDVN